MATQANVRFGPFTLDLSAGRLTRDGVPVPLQTQPARVLAHLVSHAGAVVSREELRQTIWGGTYVHFDDGLNYCIRQIRIALGDDAKSPTFLRTVPQRGYSFIGVLEAARPVAATAPVRRRRVVVPAAAAAALVVGMIAGVQLAATVAREVAPASDSTAVLSHLSPLHLARGAWTHHIAPALIP